MSRASKVLEKIEQNEAKSMDGDILHVGDNIGYKDGFEKYGKIKAISGGTLKISVYNDNTGEEDTISMRASQVWKEG